MKKLLVTLAAVLVSASAFAQGTVIFNNRPSTGDAKVSRPDGSGAGAGITAQLFLVGSGGALTALTPTTTFRTTSAAAAYFVNAITDFAVPGVAAGSPATLRLRAYDSTAASYDAAKTGGKLYGESNDVTISQLGGTPPGGGAPIPTPELAGLTGINLTQVPEPSTIALGVLGAAALFARRRK
jgi:hypothetical protein